MPLDANGIHQYVGSELAAPAPEMLNRLGASTSTQVKALRDKTVRTFASAAARTTAIPTPLEGAVTWLQDVDRLEVWSGAAWVSIGPELTSAGTGPGLTAFSPDYVVGQLARTARLVTFIGHVSAPTGVTTGSTIWSLPAGWFAQSGQGVQLTGWATSGAARFQLLPGSPNITYQAGGSVAAGAYLFLQAHWFTA